MKRSIEQDIRTNFGTRNGNYEKSRGQESGNKTGVKRICVGCDIVEGDHAPDGGVAQGVIHGVVIRHHGRNQEEVEEELKKEIEGPEEEDSNQTTMCTCMDEMR